MALDLLGNWTPGIGDPSIAGWCTVAAYFGTSALCVRALRRGGEPRLFWIGLATLMALLGINKQLDFQSLLTELARNAAHAGHWFQARRIVQAIFVAAVGLGGLFGAVLVLRFARAAPRPTRIAAIGTVILIGFVVIRAASFHHIDGLLGMRLGILRWNVWLELTGIAIIAAAATAAAGPFRPRRAALFLASVAAIFVATIFLVSEWSLRKAYALAPEKVTRAGPESIAEGKRLAKLYGCTSCHGADYRGHHYNGDPLLVRQYAPNLTLLARTSSDEQFAQAVRQGVRPSDGHALWNMPSPTFVTMTDAELGAVLADLRSRPAGGKPTPIDGAGFAARMAIVQGLLVPLWRPLSDEARRETQVPAPVLVARARADQPKDLGAKLAHGRHLAATICAECHGSDLTGDVVEGGPNLEIVGSYQPEDFKRLMRTGKPPGGRDLGIMTETARDDLKVLTDAEIADLYAYLYGRVLSR